MENCIYKGKTICTFDLKDENGYYYEDSIILWKQAAAERQLICPDCGSKVYLAAGPIKEPYFAHYDLVDCDYGNGHESEELKKGKRLLYNLIRRSLPDSEVRARHRMENGMYSSLYCKTEGYPDIAVDFRLQNNSLAKFTERDFYYHGNQIRPIYILGKGQDKDTRQLDWFQTLIQNSVGYVAFLDTDQEGLILKKCFSYRIGKLRKFRMVKRSFSLRELYLNPEGHFICNFDEQCEKESRLIEKEKEEYQRIQEKAKLLQELDPALLLKCRKMIKEGNAHLVSRKYYDAIRNDPEGRMEK